MISFDQFVVIGGSKGYRVVKVTNDQVNISRMKFRFKNAIGLPYGTCFEVKNQQLYALPPSNTSMAADNNISSPGAKKIIPKVDLGDHLDDDEEDVASVDAAKNGFLATLDHSKTEKILPGSIDSQDDDVTVINDVNVAEVDNKMDDNNKICPVDVQKLTAEDVKALKDSGARPDDLVAKLAENNKNFQHRTAFSKQKYLAKKKRKHSNVVCLFRPTLRLLAHIFYCKDVDKICCLRVDNLALLLNLSNVQYGSKVIVVENCAGLVTSGVLERLNGRGVCVHFHRNDQPQAVPALNAMNFTPEQLSTLYPVSYKRILDDGSNNRDSSECNKEDQDIPMPLAQEFNNKNDEDLPTNTVDIDDNNDDNNITSINVRDECVTDEEEDGEAEAETTVAASCLLVEEEQQQQGTSTSSGTGSGRKKRNRKRKMSALREAYKQTHEQRRSTNRAKREEALRIFDETTFESLIIACRQHPLDFLKPLAPKMEPSSQLVIHSLHIRLLFDCYTWLREQDIAINLKLTENFYRTHQVLPGRTHPDMNQMVAGGYILSGIFVEK